MKADEGEDESEVDNPGPQNTARGPENEVNIPNQIGAIKSEAASHCQKWQCEWAQVRAPIRTGK